MSWRIMALAGAMFVLGACAEEDGGPYPPTRPLVQCHADAGPDDPEACPDMAVEPLDAGVRDLAPPDLAVELVDAAASD